jgi:hypothetical protein
MRNSFNVPAIIQILDKSEIMALKALDACNANERQQKIALNAITKICRVGKSSYCEQSPSNTAFNEGVRYVGIQINSAILCDINKLELAKTQFSLTKK